MKRRMRMLVQRVSSAPLIASAPICGTQVLISLPACYCLWEVVLRVATASILSLVCNSDDASAQPGSQSSALLRRDRKG